MPTYEYACKSCGQHIEVVQSFTDDALTTCPACSGALRKVFGNIGISFKGTGFYKNDSRSSTRSGSPSANGDGPSSSESTRESSSADSGSSPSEKAPPAKESSSPSPSAAPKDGGAKTPSAPATSKAAAS